MGDLGRRRLASTLRLAVMAAACGVVLVGAGTAASAGAALTGPNGDPPGANGTVKINDIDVSDTDNSPANQPHVGCQFNLKFFGFDNRQTAHIVLKAWSPTGDDGRVLWQGDRTISPDAAGGGPNDLDAVFTFDSANFDFSSIAPQPKQGYHVKLFVELDGLHAVKHKVFWLGLCQSSSTPSPGGDTSSTPGGGTNGGGTNGGGTNGGGTNGGGGGGGGLPITGPEAGGIATAGLGLVGGGVALVLIRRRRRITFTSGD